MDYTLVNNIVEMNKYGHTWNHNSKGCKYCGLDDRVDTETIKTIKCLSDDEKIIKDIIE
jgi:hypothetical protein